MNALDAVCWTLRWSGAAKAYRFLVGREKATIVNYHNPSVQVFSQHLEYFTRSYSIIGMEELSAALVQRDFSRLPPNPMVITLDDGHVGNYALRETIEKLGVPVTIYLVSGMIGTGRHFWFKHAGLESTELAFLKSLPNDERLSRLSSYGYADEAEYPVRHVLNNEEVRKLQDAGVSFGSHTVSHPILTRCTADEVRAELVKSRRDLESLVHSQVVHFAYPNGDWNSEVQQAVVEAGYSTARTIQPGFVSVDSNPFGLPNFGISDDAGLNKAILQSSGLWYLLKRIVNPRMTRA